MLVIEGPEDVIMRDENGSQYKRCVRKVGESMMI